MRFIQSVLPLFFLSLFAVSGKAACPVELISLPTEAARKLTISTLAQYMKCDPKDLANDKSPCNTFASRGLEAIYNVTDFKTANGHLAANAMLDYVAGHSQWVKIGTLWSEDNNLCAQALANNAFPVIVLLKEAGHGHVALITPGEPARSPSWGFNVAKSASFLLDRPGSAYLDGLISRAFKKEDAINAVLYYRKADLPGVKSANEGDAIR